MVIKDIKALSKSKFSALIIDLSANKEYKSEFRVAEKIFDTDCQMGRFFSRGDLDGEEVKFLT